MEDVLFTGIYRKLARMDTMYLIPDICQHIWINYTEAEDQVVQMLIQKFRELTEQNKKKHWLREFDEKIGGTLQKSRNSLWNQYFNMPRFRTTSVIVR